MKKFYKGFNEDLTCRGFQYEEGKTYEESESDLCHKGFHACEDPLDCFSYYAPGSSQFREVILDGISDRREADSKVCAKKITIGARLNFSQLVKASFEFRWSKTTLEPGASATGDYGAASATGNYGAASATGKHSVAAAFGKNGKAKASLGNWIVLTERGDWDGSSFPIISVKAFEVDGVDILPDTWYTLKNGKPEKTE